jgi:putative ABC transport system permease protein
MLSLLDHDNLRGLFNYTDHASTILISIFVFIMSVVLWNAGLMNGIRRYGEIGVRLAIGEDKFKLYRVMIYESVLIGLAGSLAGTTIGLAFSYYWQSVGIDISGAMPDVGMMMSDVLRTRVTTGAYFIGFIPGLFATTLGAALAGRGIFKRNTAQLFKELEQ